MPGSSDTSIDKSNEKKEIKEHKESNVTINVSQNKMVRTDSSEQKIDKFLDTSNSSVLMLPKSKSDAIITQ